MIFRQQVLCVVFESKRIDLIEIGDEVEAAGREQHQVEALEVELVRVVVALISQASALKFSLKAS